MQDEQGFEDDLGRKAGSGLFTSRERKREKRTNRRVRIPHSSRQSAHNLLQSTILVEGRLNDRVDVL
jgi:hypothetical protein